MTLSAETIAIALDAIRDRYYPATSRVEHPRDRVQAAIRELMDVSVSTPALCRAVRVSRGGGGVEGCFLPFEHRSPRRHSFPSDIARALEVGS